MNVSTGYIHIPYGKLQLEKKKKLLKTLGWSNFLNLQNWNPRFEKANILPEAIEPVFAIAKNDSWLRFFSTSASTASLVLSARNKRLY